MFHCAAVPVPTCSTLTRSSTGRGAAPETILATKFVADTPPTVQMTRPLCLFPKVAKYKGSGSTDSAANFVCVPHENDDNQTPAPKYGP